MSILRKIVGFISKPRVPWFIVSRANKISPSLARFLMYGHANINTGDYWDDQWTKRDFDSRDAQYLKLTEYVVGLIPPGARLLDVGCGPGGLLKVAREEKNCTCTGIDISQVAVNEAISQGFDGFVTELPDLPQELEATTFDVVTAMEVLEHLTKPDRTVANLSKLIRPGGVFIASVPNDSMGPHDIDEHMQQFSIESLSKLVGVHFEVKDAEVITIDSLEYLVVVGQVAD